MLELFVKINEAAYQKIVHRFSCKKCDDGIEDAIRVKDRIRQRSILLPFVLTSKRQSINSMSVYTLLKAVELTNDLRNRPSFG